MKKITLLSLMLLLTISHAKEEIPDTISVGLSYGTNAVSSFTVSADSGVKIDGTTYKGTVTIEKSGTNKLSVSNSTKDKTVTVGSSGVKVSLVDDDEFISYNGKEYTVEHICDIIHAQGAEILGEYGKDFYKNMPAVTKNAYGEGKAFYVAFRNDEDFARDFCNDLINELSLPLDADLTLDDGLVMRKRGDVIFVMNFTDDEKTVTLDKEYKDLIKGEAVSGSVTIAPCSYLVIE